MWPSARAQPLLPAVHVLPPLLFLACFIRGRAGTSESTLQLPAGKEPAPGSPASRRGLVLRWKTTACSSAAACRLPLHGMRFQHFQDYSPRGCVTGCSQRTHTKYTMLPANILIITLNKRPIWSLKGIFLKSVALCCCGNRIPRAYPEIRIFLRYWVILLTLRIGKAKIIPSKQADLWRSLIFSFGLHLAQSWTFPQHADIYQVTMQIA